MNKRPKWAREARIVMMDKGMTVTKLAENLGVGTQYVSNILTGCRKGESLAKRIFDYLQVPFDEAG